MYDEETGLKIVEYPLGESLPYNLADDYTLHTPEGVESRLDRHFMGIIDFAVKGGTTYWMLSPSTQLGLFGLMLTAGPDGIAELTSSSSIHKPIFNLAGQRINNMQKGINIVNGKKVLF